MLDLILMEVRKSVLDSGLYAIEKIWFSLSLDEAIHMNHGKLPVPMSNFAREAPEDVQEVHSEYGKIHVDVIEAMKLDGNAIMMVVCVPMLDQCLFVEETNNIPGIHVEGYDVLLDAIVDDVTLEVLEALWVEVVGNAQTIM